ncbi:MAG TPA: hypothetical protein DIC59_05250 [Candidatus Competibacteraceae bacterium]|nr:hypothetical protein [Candidatus Competibacteraceae bacterium]
MVFWVSVAGLAATALLWQLRHPPQAPAVNTASQKPPDLPVVTPVAPFRLPVAAAYNEITGRPLFIATRRPEPPPPEEPAPEKPPAGPEKKFLLLGVMISPHLTTVLLRPEEPNAKTVRIKPGETVDGWLLEKVSPNQVVIRQGQVSRELNLVRQKRPPRARAGRTGARGGQEAAPPAVVPVVPQPGELPQAAVPPPPL